MKSQNLIWIMLALMLLSLAVSAGDFLSDENINMLGNAIHNASYVNATNGTFYNLDVTNNVSANWFKGYLNWTDVQNKFITAVDTVWVYMSGTTLNFNFTKLDNEYANKTYMANADTVINDSATQYADNLDTYQNSSLTNYINARDILYNTSATDYANNLNTSMTNYVDARDSTFNISITTYIDNQDSMINTSATEYADNQFIVLANENNLNVNSSVFWGLLDDIGEFFLRSGTFLRFNTTKFNTTYDAKYTDTYNAIYDIWALNQTIPLHDAYGNYWGINFTTGSNVYTDEKLITVFYNASSVVTKIGTPEGALSDIQAKDSISFNVSESSSDIDLRINFTNIDSFNQFVFRYKSDPTETHTSTIFVWDFTNEVWESYLTIGDAHEYVILETSIFDEENHLSGGVVALRFFSENPGGSTHKHQFDWVTISSGPATPSGMETDPFAVHKDGKTELTGNWGVGAFNISTIRWFKGLFNWIVGPSSTALFSFNGSQLDYNSSFLDDTIDDRISEQGNFTAGLGIKLTVNNFSVEAGNGLEQQLDGLQVSDAGINNTLLRWKTGQNLTSSDAPTFDNVTITTQLNPLTNLTFGKGTIILHGQRACFLNSTGVCGIEMYVNGSDVFIIG